MIKIKEFELKTKMTEFTMKEFEDICAITTEDLIDKYFGVFEVLKMPKDLMYEITTDDLIDIVKEFTKDEITNKDLIPTIEMNGRVYRSHTDEFKVKAKDFGMIQTYVKKNPTKYLLYIIAILFKDEELTNNEHYTSAHIEHKMHLFEELNADLYYQYIIFIQHNVIQKIEGMNSK